MDAELSAGVGFVVAGAATLATTPAAIAAARRLNFYDRPHEYHQHGAPTPLLGGTAVLAGLLLGAFAVGISGRLTVLLGCAVALWLLGTLDDWIPVAPVWRVLAETAAALGLISAGLGWKTSAGGAVDVVLTVAWVVGLVNGFNLMDNLDGACGTVACVSSAGIGTLAAIDGDPLLAGLAFALAGACLSFLRWNLARPAKIFLGDGGSRPIGLLVAGLAMATCRQLKLGDANVLAGALLVGLVILDTALVTVSRTRRRVTLVTGGRDHLTHRLLLARRSPRGVAGVLAVVQAILCSCAIIGARLGTDVLGVLAIASAALGMLAIVVLDSAHWRPPGIAVGVTAAPARGAVGLTAADRQ
jgi:UDP-GlcNAc:undecaprenyl-phosphate/decaprenyl-phosphate GlcNAc-1-phosphate transferase